VQEVVAAKSVPVPSPTPKLTFYRAIWLIIIFSVFGVYFEDIVYFLQLGYFHWWRGTIYGPFMPIYGIGSVLFIWIYLTFKIKNTFLLFIVFAVVGSAYEFLTHCLAQQVYGLVSWDCSNMLLNIGGRTTVWLAGVWGLGGIVIVKYGYPYFSRLIDKIPHRQGVLAAWLLVIFILVSLWITIVATQRYADRHKGIAATTAFEAYIDQKYPDTFIDDIKPCLTIKY